MTPEQRRVGPIDVHAHLFPQSAVRALDAGASWFGVEMWKTADGRPVARTERGPIQFGSPRHVEPPSKRLERMDAMGVGVQLISILPPLYQYGRQDQGKVQALRAVNDEIAEMASDGSGRFEGLAALPLPDVRAAVEEMQRAKELGHVGIAVGSHVAGKNWSGQDLLPVLRTAEELQLLVFLHPVLPRCHEAVGEHYLRNLVGNPFETTVAVASMIFGGVLDACPELEVCLAHGGGYTAFGVGRLNHGRLVRTELSDLPNAPSDYLRRFHYDTITHDGAALRHLANVVGIDRIVLGTDYPADMGLAEPVPWLESQTWLDDADRDMILHDNIRRIIREFD